MRPSNTHRISLLGFKQQLKDTYRLIFFVLLIGAAIALARQLNNAGAGVGGILGMLPALFLGLKAKLSVSNAERAKIVDYLDNNFLDTGPYSWTPRLPAHLKFASQDLFFQDNTLFGPVGTLKKIRKLLG